MYAVQANSKTMNVTHEHPCIAFSIDGANNKTLVQKANIAGVSGFYRAAATGAAPDQDVELAEVAIVLLMLTDGFDFRVDLAKVNNQVTWPTTQAGVNKAVADINAWLAL